MDEEIDMTELVDNAQDPDKDYLEGVNKEVEKQDPDPDAVIKADLEMDPGAATESFVRKNFGLSLEDIEEAVQDVQEAAEVIPDADTSAIDDDPELANVGVETPAEEETVVTVVPPAGGETVVEDDGTVPATTPEEVVPTIESNAEVAALENLNRIFGLEDEEPDMTGADEPDVSINVETPENNVDLDFEGQSVTVTPSDEGEGAPAEETPAEPETTEGEGEGVAEPEEKPEATAEGEEAWFI